MLAIDGRRREVRGDDCFLPLAEYLRRNGNVGVKVVCAEGDCGSCTVLAGKRFGDSWRYCAIDSCIRFMFQLDGAHIVTTAGLGSPAELSAVQQAMVECHGSQCGYCTPGFIASMTALRESCRDQPFDEQFWRRGLTGNLCRCTGYIPILNAARRASVADDAALENRYPASLVSELALADNSDLDIVAASGQRVQCPATMASALRLLERDPKAVVIAGGTDLGVRINKRMFKPMHLIDLNKLDSMERVKVQEIGGRRSIVAGARATWTRLLEVTRIEAPQFAAILEVFGAPQIRNVGTIGGNLINASPIADSIPFLNVMDARLSIASAAGSRQASIREFYRGYKQVDLSPGELLDAVTIPLPHPDEVVRLIKVSRRRDLDISSFTAAIRMRVVDGRIEDANLAMGGVGPIVVALSETASKLRGLPFDESAMAKAGEWASKEIGPISDVRGSVEYRMRLARNIFMKFYFEQLPCGA